MARKALKGAVRANRFVPGMLLGDREVPPEARFYSPGGEDEAGLCVELSLDTWAATEGALDWLRNARLSRSGRRARARESGRSGGDSSTLGPPATAKAFLQPDVYFSANSILNG